MTVCLPAHLFIYLLHLLIPSNVFFYFSYCIVHIFLFFKAYSSLLNISLILSVCASINFLRSWIIFTIIIPNSFRWIAFFHLTQLFFGVLSYCFVWSLFLCLLILSNFLCLWLPSFLRPLLSSASFSQDSQALEQVECPSCRC